MIERAGIALSRLAFDATYNITRVSGAPGPAIFTPATSHVLSDTSSIPKIMEAFDQAVGFDTSLPYNGFTVAYPIGANSRQREAFHNANLYAHDHFHAWANGYGVKNKSQEERRDVNFLFVDLTPGQIAAKLARGNVGSRGWTYNLRGGNLISLSEQEENERQGWPAQEVFDKFVQSIVPEDIQLNLVGILRPEGPFPNLSASELVSKFGDGVQAQWVTLDDLSYGAAIIMNRQRVYGSDEEWDGPTHTYLPTGVRLANGQILTILHANVHCPTNINALFTTYQDEQTTVTIRLLLGTSPFGNPVTLENITPKPRGQARIKVRYELTEYGHGRLFVEEMGEKSGKVFKGLGSALYYNKTEIEAYRNETTNKQIEITYGKDGVVGELPP
jgi:hypothetical protein